MKTFFTKAKYILGILVVFSLILTTNLIDRDSFRSVRNSMSTIYEDRLVAKDLIYDMYTQVKEKELALVGAESNFFTTQNGAVNRKIQDLIFQFEGTRLTTKEARIFNSLKLNFSKLWELEEAYIAAGFRDETPLLQQISRLEKDLEDLSDIQLEEGRRQLMISKQAVDTVELFTQIEIYVMILLAIVIQFVIIYTPKEESESEHNS